MAKILVIEDNGPNLQLMTYLLGAFGHTVVSASDGLSGIDTARRQRPELILCDLHLPKLDGYSVRGVLRTDPALRRTPIIAVTASAMMGDRDRVIRSGFDGYISKPIDPEAFIGQVDAFLPAGSRSMDPRKAERS
jgi:CheY-like chemotaxis protein